MSFGDEIEIRPRTSGEIMDDAWRLYLAHAPTLLLLTSLSYVPMAVLVLLLLTTRPPANFMAQFAIPTLTALAVPLTGLGAGACQEAFLKSQVAPGDGPLGISPIACLKSALRSGLEHITARAVIAALTFLGMILLVLPGLTIWGGSGPLHPILAGKESSRPGSGLFQAFWTASQESQRQPGKVLALTVGRAFLLVFAVINLHTLALVGVWVGETLAGFDWSVLAAGLSLRQNPTYGVVLVLLAWLLLAPYNEAVNYLFHMDARSRYEGLDLWHRARQHFRLPDKAIVASISMALAAVLCCPVQARSTGPFTSVRAARQKIAAIRQEIQSKEPFPGGGFWTAPLRQVASQLDPDGNRDRGKFRWLHRAIQNFQTGNREDALLALDDIDQKLALIEENLLRHSDEDNPPGTSDKIKEQIKELLSKEEDDSGNKPHEKNQEQRRKTESRRDDREVDVHERQRERGSGFVAPASTTGLNTFGWITFWGVLLALCAIALIIARRNWMPKQKSVKAPIVEKTKPSLENLLARSDPQTIAELWRQADDLARHGQFLEAVRSLYLAALVLLHRSNLIRFEPTRTNGEYLNQLKPHEDLQHSFQAMTGIFELKWYGERVCQLEDFSSCRELAEIIRGQAIGHLS